MAVGEGQEALTSGLADRLVPIIGGQDGAGLPMSVGAACELACRLLRENRLGGDEAGSARTVEIGVVTQDVCHILGEDDVKKTC